MDWLELLMLIAAWGVLGAIGLFVVGRLWDGNPVISISMGVFIVGYLARVLAITLNEEFMFFEPKLQGDRSMSFFEKYIMPEDWGGLLGEEFAAQVFLNIPVWLIFGVSRMALLLSNACVGALAAPIAAVLLYRNFGPSVSKRALWLLSLYPAGFNFSIFGLRDPLIFLGMLVLAVVIARSWFDRLSIKNFLLGLFAALITLWLRPELLYVVLMFCLVPIINAYLNLVVNSLRSRKALASLILLTVPVVAIGLISVVFATRIAASNIGAQTLNPAEIASEQAVDRFERHDAEFGGGSHMISGDLYRNLPWYLRVPVQTAGLILLPFPWQVTSVSRLLAFGDSLFLIMLIFVAALNAKYDNPIRTQGLGRLTFMMLFVFLIGIVGLGFVVSNFGNGFRMKLAVTPMIFVAAAVCPVRVRVRLRAKREPVAVAY